MRDKFRGYYRPTADEEDALWNSNALIIMDTNVVLDLYRYHPKTTQLYLDSLRKFAARVWLPYQVGLEFHQNRPKVRADSTSAHKARIDAVQTLVNQLKSTTHKTRISSLAIEGELLAAAEEALSSLRAEMEQIRQDALPRSNDPILDSVSDLFHGRVGDKPSDSDLAAMTKTGKERFDNEIPPGYKDRGKKPKGEEYGDYYMWRQILDKAHDAERDIIFATEDSKADWSWKVGDQVVGVRPELIQEFRAETGREIIIYSGKDFFQQLSDRAEAATKSDIADALKDVSEVSSIRLANSDSELERRLFSVISSNDRTRHSLAGAKSLDSWLRGQPEHIRFIAHNIVTLQESLSVMQDTQRKLMDEGVTSETVDEYIDLNEAIRETKAQLKFYMREIQENEASDRGEGTE